MDYSLINFLQTRPVIALVGATNDRRKYGNVILKDLLRKGYEVIPVNQKATTVEGIEAFHTLEQAQKRRSDIGLVVFVIPPKMALETLKQARELGFFKVWFQPGAADKNVIEYVEKEKMSYLVDQCVMVETA